MKRWLIWSVLALVFFGGWAFAPKLLSPEISSFDGQALSTAGLLPILLALGLAGGIRDGASTRKGAALAFAAGLLGATGNVPYFEALRRPGSKAMTVVPLTALYPLVTVALAFALLRERPGAAQIGGIALAMAALAAFNPFEAGADLGTYGGYVLLPILLWGTAGLLQKLATNHASSRVASFWFHAAYVPVAAAILIWSGGAVWDHSPRDWTVLILIGLFLGLGNVTLIAAFGSGGKASVVTPLSGLYSLIVIPLAMLVGERAGWREVVGIALALAAVVALSLEREKETQGVGQAP